MRKQSRIEAFFFTQLKGVSKDWSVFDEPKRNYKFIKESSVLGKAPRYEMDFAWPKWKLGVEIQGGIFLSRCRNCRGTGRKKGLTCKSCLGKGKSVGAHARSSGIQRDITKAQWAALLEWTLIPVSSADVNDGTAISVVLKLIAKHK